MLTLALTKGRILEETLPLLARAGIKPFESISNSRKLHFNTENPNVRLLVLRSSDVPTYVHHGAADMGISGKDTLLEYESDAFYEWIDLGIATCTLMTAGIKGQPRKTGRIRVATKFVKVAREFYAKKGQQADVIKLYGAMELAPIENLADEIVDIVDTGNTLRANGLESLDSIAHISSRLIVNKASLKLKNSTLQPILKAIEDARYPKL